MTARGGLYEMPDGTMLHGNGRPPASSCSPGPAGSMNAITEDMNRHYCINTHCTNRISWANQCATIGKPDHCDKRILPNIKANGRETAEGTK